MIKLSILIPVYNVEKYLDRCLDNIYRQISDNDCEIVLVDDGSTDSSGEICDKFAAAHAKETTVHHIANGGAGHARNYLINHCRGEYFWFVDSDDNIEDGAINSIFHLLEKYGDIDIISMNYKQFDGNGNYSDLAIPPVEEGIVCGKSYLQNNMPDPYLWSKVYWKAFVDENNIRFNDKLYTQEDWLFNIKAYLSAQRVLFTNLHAYNYFTGNQSSTLRNPTYEYKLRGMNNTMLALEELKKIIDTTPESHTLPGLQEQLSLTTAGFVHALAVDLFPWKYITEQIKKLKAVGIYPISKCLHHKKANIFILLANHKPLLFLYYFVIVKLLKIKR